MRKTSLLIGSLALLALPGSSVASTGYSFSRPNTDYTEFRHDQRMCERASFTAKRAYEQPSLGFTERGSSGEVSIGPTSLARYGGKTAFVECMASKGYHLDPTGFRTGPLWTLQER